MIYHRMIPFLCSIVRWCVAGAACLGAVGVGDAAEALRDKSNVPTTPSPEAWEKQLLAAAEAGNVSEVHRLLDQGGNVECRNDEDGTPLYLAMRENHVDVVRLLLERGANANAVYARNVRPIHLAALWGEREIVQLLLDAGADVNAVSDVGGALAFAAAGQQVETMGMLVAAGASLRVEPDGGYGVLACAAARGEEESVRLLLSAGGDARAKDADGVSLLEYAAAGGKTPIAQILLNAGADVHHADGRGNTPLHVTVLFGHVPMAELLLETGADVNAANAEGNTPLHLAVSREEADGEEMVQLLQRWGARSDLANQQGLTGEHLAAKRSARQNDKAEKMAMVRAFVSEVSAWLRDAVAALDTVCDKTSADRAAIAFQDLNARLDVLRGKAAALKTPQLKPESLLTEDERKEMERLYAAMSQHVRNLERSNAYGSSALMEKMKQWQALLD